MPLVRIAMIQGKSAEYRRAVCDAILRALVEAVNVPQKDRFQLLTEHRPEELIYDDSYLGISRSPDVLVIQITLNIGRTVEMKRALFARIAELLAQSPGVRKEDVFSFPDRGVEGELVVRQRCRAIRDGLIMLCQSIASDAPE